MNTDVIDLVEQALSKFAQSVPNILGAFLLAVLGFFIAKALGRGVSLIVQKIGIDRVGEKLNKTDLLRNTEIKVIPSKLLGRLVFVIILLIFLTMATDLLEMDTVSNLVKDIVNYVPNLVSALILLILGIILADFIKGIVDTATASLGIPSGKVISVFVFYLVFLTMTISALAQAKIDTSLITSNMTVVLGGVVAAFALGYGFAAKDIMANFLASFYSKKNIKKGDIIKLDGVKGEIIDMDTNAVTIATDESIIVIPMKKMTTEKIEIFLKK